MPYILEICKAGNTIEYRKYYTCRINKPGGKRGKNKKPTTEEQSNINLRNAIRKLTRKMNTNFSPGDFHVVLDYDPACRPQTWEEMYEDVRKFLRDLRKEYKKSGKILKYIRVMERGKKGARHHHIVLNEIPPGIIRKYWKKGRVHINLLDDSGQYRKLAAYFLKFTDQAVKDGELKKRWDASKNLKEPKIKKIIVGKKFFKTVPKVERGYYLDKGSVEVYTDANGNKQFSYTCVRIRSDTS